MSSEELREQVAAIKPGDIVTARFDLRGHYPWTVSGVVRMRNGWLVVGPDNVITRGDAQPTEYLVAIESHEPAKPPVPPKFGELARARCTAPGVSIGGDPPLVLYVSAADNDLAVDEWDGGAGAPVSGDLPAPGREAAIAASSMRRYLEWRLAPKPSPERIEELAVKYAKEEYGGGCTVHMAIVRAIREAFGGEQ